MLITALLDVTVLAIRFTAWTPGLLNRAVMWQMHTAVSETHTASIFRDGVFSVLLVHIHHTV
jgi:hypothetical protein